MARRNLKQIKGSERRRLGDVRPELIQARIDPMIKERKAQIALRRNQELRGNGGKVLRSSTDSNGVKASDVKLSKSDKRRIKSKARKRTPLIPKGYDKTGKMGLF